MPRADDPIFGLAAEFDSERAIVRAAKPDPSGSVEAQAACCEPSEKAGCCSSDRTEDGGCGCS